MKKLGPYTTGEIPMPLVVQFLDAAGAAINLSGFDAVFVMGPRGGTMEEKAAAVTNATSGEVTYTWVDGDLDDAGYYRAEMWASNGTNRFASERYKFSVNQALAEPSI